MFGCFSVELVAFMVELMFKGASETPCDRTSAVQAASVVHACERLYILPTSTLNETSQRTAKHSKCLQSASPIDGMTFADLFILGAKPPGHKGKHPKPKSTISFMSVSSRPPTPLV